MSEINLAENAILRFLLKFDGVTCPGCVVAIEKVTKSLRNSKFKYINESSGDTIITSSLSIDQIKSELSEFEGCCSDCQISIKEVEETDLSVTDYLSKNQDKFGLVKRQYKVALERALEGIDVACSENCVCKTTEIDRLLESNGAPSFASVYNLSDKIKTYLKVGKMITDFGSGTGHDVFRIAPIINPGIITGIDVTPEMVQFATNEAKKQNIKNAIFIEGSNLLEIKNQSQDLIYVNNVLNLLNEKSSFLNSAFEKLTTQGILVIADEFALEEFPTDLRNDEAFLCGGISGAEFVEDMEIMSSKTGFRVENWETVKEYTIEFNNKQYKLKTAILILKKS